MSTKMKQVAFAILTVVVYTALLNWKVALLLAIAVGFHEYGHLWAARRMGLQTKGFYLLPFMGGVALVNDTYKSYSQQAFVALMGPVWGAFLALVSFGVWFLTRQSFWLQATEWMAILNLFNLLPLSFMDGGQIMGTLTYSVHRTLGMVCYVLSTLVASIVLWVFNPVLALIVGVFGGMSAGKEIKNWYQFYYGSRWLCDDSYLHRPKKQSVMQMALTCLCWLAVSAALLYMIVTIHNIPNSDMKLLFK